MRISDWSSDVCSSDLTERGYDKPLFFNSQAGGADQFTETIFFARSVPLLRFDFGFSDGGRDIGHEIGERMGPSLALALPTLDRKSTRLTSSPQCASRMPSSVLHKK